MTIFREPFRHPFRDPFTGSLGFTPDELTPAAWYDWSDASLLFTDAGTTPVSSDADAIYQANDKSGNGLHLTQSTLAKRLLYKVGIQNSLSIGRGDGVDDFMANAALNIPQPFTAFVVIKIVDANDSGIFDSVGVDACAFFATAGNMSLTAGGVLQIDSAVRDTNFNIFKTTSNAASSEIVKNNGTPETGTIESNSLGGLTIMTVRQSIPGFYNQGDLCEMIFIPGVLSDAASGSMWSWLNSKWGIF